MKVIEIKGKRNIDKLNKISAPIRKDATKYSFNDDYYKHRMQIELVNKLFLGEEIIQGKLLKQAINKKISGYKSQDIQKQLFDINWFISLDYVIERLVSSKLKCYYCNDICQLLYKDCLAKNQWTLDRIDNSMGHNTNNVVICCLECNVKRGNMDSERFKRGKEIKIVRKQF
jgi:5-methylcytosine-specific restriction endonuclease McrA